MADSQIWDCGKNLGGSLHEIIGFHRLYLCEHLYVYFFLEPHVYMMLLLNPWRGGDNATQPMDFSLEHCTFTMGRVYLPSSTETFPKTWVPVVAVLFLAIPLAGFCYCLYRCIKYHYLKDEVEPQRGAMEDQRGAKGGPRAGRGESDKFLQNQDNYEL